MADFKDNWKGIGTGLGHAFRDLGRAVGKTTADGIDNATEWACGEETHEASVQKEDWEKVGKGLGSAFTNFGKAVVKTAKFGVDKAVEWAEDDTAKNDSTEDKK